MSSTGSPFHAASKPAATIMMATAPSITPRRPTTAAMRGTTSSVAMVPAAKMA